MNKQALTPAEQREAFYVSLGRLKIAIRQADFSKQHKERALALYEKVASDIDELSDKIEGLHASLTGLRMYEEEEEEATIEEIIANHDCTLSPEDGCEVCSRYLPDYVPAEEEEEEESLEEWIDTFQELEPSHGGPDHSDVCELIPDHIDGLNGEESALVIEQMYDEIEYGESRGEVAIH